ncbi:hypothetical protein TYRP_020278 [Tyrophagus putrescentiae]|nr:hypothetical protein TYRP_020278 [Tyrophagus putrescentiae]
MSGILRLVRHLYSPRLLPYTNTVAGAVFFTLGDGTSALAGAVLGYLGSFWYPLLERLAPGTGPRAIVRKLAIESALGLALGGAVFLLVGAIQGREWEANVANVRANFPYLVATEAFLYLPAQWINFRYVPMAFRMLYVECVQLAYDCVFIYLLYKVEFEEH